MQSRTIYQVTMTAFTTHYLRSTRLDMIRLFACVCLIWSICSSALAEPPLTEVSLLRIERFGDDVQLTATVKFELPTAVEDALLKGVAIIFVAEADVFRDRWYWMNKKVATAERHMRLAYQPLTRRWRLNVASGVITNAGLGVALNQNFDSLSDALAVVRRLSRWKISEMADIDLEQRNFIEFRYRLDISQLPRPLQIGTLGQSDWNISVTINRPLVFESVK